MEDDDEFGDLYTDVLSTFPSSSDAAAVPHMVDLNLDSTIKEIDSDADGYPNTKVVQDDLGTRVSQTIDLNFGIEEEEEEEQQQPAIPGLNNNNNNNNNNTLEPPQPQPAPITAAAHDDWEDSDSDSEDDLQIVLNDTHHGPMGMGMDPNGFMPASDDDDDNGQPLVIVSDDAAAAAAGGLPLSDPQDWGDEVPLSAEPKDSSDASKALPTPPKIGFTNYGYHPFHSQFKYVRPGAAPLPGGPSVGSGGASGQVRPAVSLNTLAGRGRGDWRPPSMKGPPLQKNFHPGFWGSNVPGRGLDFTLPSHKTIFEVDIDSFEEKPWKYSGVDVSDFFNFGLNEDSWKEYCKQLEQLRLESTMQSKIRVYESGRTEQEYDPDMPPELALATGIHDSSAENVDMSKVDLGQGDLGKGSARLRPSLPTGRAIQVETGCGERLPSVDTRPPRIRDSDAVIEIVLRNPFDNESAGNEAVENPDNDTAREEDQVDVVDEDDPQCGNACIGGYPGAYNLTEDGSQKRSTIIDSHIDINEEGDGSSPPRAQSDQHPGSVGHDSSENAGSPYGDSWVKQKARSPHMSSGESALDRRSLDYRREDSVGSLEAKLSPELSSAIPAEDAQVETLAMEADTEDDQTDVEFREGKDVNVVASTNTSKDKHSLHSEKQQNLNSEVEPPLDKKVDGGGFKTSRSNDNIKVTGSSRDRQKWREGVDEEVVQNGRNSYLGDSKRNRGESGHDLQRKDRDVNFEMEKNYVLSKEREEYCSHQDRESHVGSLFNAKSESSDYRKVYTEAGWPKRDEDAHGGRIRAEDARKQMRADDLVSRRRGKVREVDRSDKDEYLHSRKILDNGSWRGYHDKDMELRYRAKDDSSKSRHDVLDDNHSKRRKDDEHARRDHVEKEESLSSHKDSSNTRRKRERDVLLSQRKREDQPRMRDNVDDHHSVRVKDEVWVQRERAEHQRERDDWYRPKQSYEEVLSRRKREDGRIPIRSSRNIEEKMWVGHARGGEEYLGHDKDTGRHNEQLKRRERVEEDASWQHRGGDDVYARGNQFSIEGKRSRQERSHSRNNRVDTSESQRLQEKKLKENIKKPRDSEGHRTFGQSKRQGDKCIANEMADVKGISEQALSDHDTSFTREGREDASSDDDLHNSKRGRSKLERWTSHKERDYDTYSKSSSLKMEMNNDKIGGSVSSSGVHDESTKKNEAGDSNQALARGKEGGGSKGKCIDERPSDGQHLDTVEKLKRRSERFKLPLTSEKDPLAIKKMENEPLPSTQNDAASNAEVKMERPPRKRRWISS